MRIAMFYPAMEKTAGGTFRAVLDLVTGLEERGHDVTVISGLFDAELCEIASMHAIELVPAFSKGHGRLRVPRLRRMRSAVEASDVLHLHGIWSLTALALVRIAAGADVPYLVTPHGSLDRWPMAQSPLRKRAFLLAGGRRMLEGAEAAHFTAWEEARQATEVVPGVHTIVVPYVVDYSAFMAGGKTPPVSERPHQVVFLGRLHPKKGVSVLLRAFATVWRELPNWRLTIAGTGDMRYVDALKREAAGLGVADQVTWLGFVWGSEKVDLLQKSPIVVAPTHQENFGIALFEALAAGAHVITTKGVDVWHALLQSGNASIVDQDPESMARAIVKAVRAKDADMRSRAGSAWVGTELARSQLLDRWEEMLRTVQARGRG